jgi:glycosyltransferase involved in cell wall biosynthesis
MYKFSIIIPTFNSEKTLAVSLQSIQQQSIKNIEVLVMDGGSTDGTLQIASQFATQLEDLHIYTERDKGIYDAMNKAMEKATGDWLFFMGSDDFFYETTVLAKIAKAASKSTDVIYGNAKIIGDTGWAKDGDVYDGIFDLPKLLNQNICHQSMFYRREFLKKEVGTFSLKYKKSSDWDFNLRCWTKGNFQYLDMIIANFSAGGFSTHSNDIAISEDFVNNVRSYFKIDLFHPLLNNPKFAFFGDVLRKQKAEHPLRWKFEKLKKRLSSKIRKFLK